jgi:hypothetical protein
MARRDAEVMPYLLSSVSGLLPRVLLLVSAALVLTVVLMPNKVLRILLQIYPKGHDRRVELEAEFYARTWFKRVFWLVALVEVVFVEGIPTRLDARRQVTPTSQKGRRTNRHVSAICAMVAIALGTLIDVHAPPWAFWSGQRGSATFDNRFNPDFEDQPNISDRVEPQLPENSGPNTQETAPNTSTPDETVPNAPESGSLTDDERNMLQLMDPKDRARYLLQKRIQEKAEASVLLSQLQSLRHQTSISVISTIR